jgi:hypothetical protein
LGVGCGANNSTQYKFLVTKPHIRYERWLRFFKNCRAMEEEEEEEEEEEGREGRRKHENCKPK